MSLLYQFLVIEILLLGLATAAGSHSDVLVYCGIIGAALPGRISYPNSTIYDASLASYYSGQESDLKPGCIFTPTTTLEVSTFVKLVTSDQECSKPPQFAIRGGGHMIWSGAANIEGGITVDMRSMNSLVLSDDKTVASLGTGGIWSEIYTELVPLNLTVMGGRVAGIGVGGLALGGGISYLSRRHGWVCDNIYNYEIVLASGEIVDANADNLPDLWLALKGGSNNFGIVTRIDVPTWPMGQMWGGSIAFNYTNATLGAEAQAFSEFMDPANFDDAADMGMALVFQNPGGAYALGNSLFYVESVENPPVYQRFTSIPGQIGNSLGLANLSSFPIEAGGTLPADTRRAIDIVCSFKNGDATLYQELFQAWEDGTNSLTDIDGLQLVLLIQPHPVTNGTNSLGLSAGEKDVVLSVITASYANSEDDETVQNGMQAIVDKHQEILQNRDLYIPFQYLNYADKTQDPIGSYGEEVKIRLQQVSRKYDPDGVFQKQVETGFKLFN
ncbi:hypothetical protein AB5N19_12550 [Seiridium cardinale]